MLKWKCQSLSEDCKLEIAEIWIPTSRTHCTTIPHGHFNRPFRACSITQIFPHLLEAFVIMSVHLLVGISSLSRSLPRYDVPNLASQHSRTFGRFQKFNYQLTHFHLIFIVE